MSYPLTLKSLNPREAITDALYRALIAFDENNIPMFDPAFAGEDVSFVLNGNATNRLEAIRSTLLSHIGPMVREIHIQFISYQEAKESGAGIHVLYVYKSSC